MALYARSSSGSYAPPEDQYLATLKNIVDLGRQENGAYGVKPRLRFVWELTGTKNPRTGLPYEVSEFFTNSLFKDKKRVAKLRERVEGMLGRELTPEELQPDSFDLESLIGNTAFLTITHVQDDEGKTWARVTEFERDSVPF